MPHLHLNETSYSAHPETPNTVPYSLTERQIMGCRSQIMSGNCTVHPIFLAYENQPLLPNTARAIQLDAAGVSQVQPATFQETISYCARRI